MEPEQLLLEMPAAAVACTVGLQQSLNCRMMLSPGWLTAVSSPHASHCSSAFLSFLSHPPYSLQPKPRVLFVRRVHYVAHPRHNGQIVRRLDNEDAIFDYLRDKAAQPDAAFTLVNGLFSGMTVPEQVALIQDACVIMGAHGAGLSHVLFAPQGAHMLELRPPAFQRPHFIAYAQWAGVTHHDWALFTSAPEPAEVLTRLQRVLDIAAGRRSFDAVGDGDAPPLNPGDVPPFPVTTVEMPERQKALRGLP